MKIDKERNHVRCETGIQKEKENTIDKKMRITGGEDDDDDDEWMWVHAADAEDNKKTKAKRRKQ